MARAVQRDEQALPLPGEILRPRLHVFTRSRAHEAALPAPGAALHAPLHRGPPAARPRTACCRAVLCCTRVMTRGHARRGRPCCLVSCTAHSDGPAMASGALRPAESAMESSRAASRRSRPTARCARQPVRQPSRAAPLESSSPVTPNPITTTQGETH